MQIGQSSLQVLRRPDWPLKRKASGGPAGRTVRTYLFLSHRIKFSFDAFSQRIALNTITANGQKNTDWMDFRFENGRLSWQHIFEDAAGTRQDIARCFASPEWCGEMRIEWHEKSDSLLVGTLHRKLNYMKYELAANSSPIYIMKGVCEYIVRIDIRDYRYRVTISGIRFDTAEFSTSFNRAVYGLAGAEEKEDWRTIESTMYNSSGKLKRYFVPYVIPMLQNMWLAEYGYRESYPPMSEDW